MTLPTASTPFFLGLSPDQRPATQARERSVIIRGGPGSGRTHTLMGRAHHLLSQGEGPFALNVWLAHPYAAQDFRRRFAATSMDPADPPRISIGTLYSAAYRYLDSRGEATLERSPDFTIWNRLRAAAEMERAARRVLPKSKRGEAVRILNWYISNRNRYRQGPLPARRREWHEVVEIYEATKRHMDVLDLEDLVSEASRALEADPARYAMLQSSCKNLLVDDFQEMTLLQYRFFELMAGEANSVTIAVDLHQTLGACQGADYRVPEIFSLDHRDRAVYDLGTDHRATPEISAIGHTLRGSDLMPALSRIAPNLRLRPLRANRLPPVLLDFPGTQQQLVQLVLDLAESFEKRGEFGWEDMALVTFKDRISTDLLTELARRQVPFRMSGAIDRQGLHDVHRVKTILSLLVRPHDRSALVDVILSYHDDYTGRRRSGLDASIAEVCRDEGVPPVEACARLLERGSITSARTRFVMERVVATSRLLAPDLQKNAPQIRDFLQLACQYFQGANRGSPATGAASHMDRLLVASLDETGPPRRLATAKETIIGLLAVWDLGEYNGVPSRNGLTITTLAAAAGSQWRCVWLIDASDHLIPGNDTAKDEEELEQEQRRFYVASTRAADRLYYCNARGGGLGFEARPTRYLAALEGLVERQEIEMPTRHGNPSGTRGISEGEGSPDEVQP